MASAADTNTQKRKYNQSFTFADPLLCGTGGEPQRKKQKLCDIDMSNVFAAFEEDENETKPVDSDLQSLLNEKDSQIASLKAKVAQLEQLESESKKRAKTVKPLKPRNKINKSNVKWEQFVVDNHKKSLEYIRICLLAMNAINEAQTLDCEENKHGFIKANEENELYFNIFNDNYTSNKKGFGNILGDIQAICDNQELDESDKLFIKYAYFGKMMRLYLQPNLYYRIKLFDDSTLMKCDTMFSECFDDLQQACENDRQVYFFVYAPIRGGKKGTIMVPGREAALKGLGLSETDAKELRFVGMVTGIKMRHKKVLLD